jgi:hypothetical protein
MKIRAKSRHSNREWNASILAIAFLVAITGCSGIEGTAGNSRVTANLLTNIEEDHGKPVNPRVHPGQPVNEGWWPDP